MKKIPVLLLFPFVIFSCSEKKPQEQVNEGYTDTTVQKDFFPVTSFLEGQILEMDSLPITPLRLITINDKTDSQWIKREKAKMLLQPFLSPVIAENNLTKFFKENKFNDQTINAITLMYTPSGNIPDSIPLQTWTIYVDPQHQKVSKIFIVKNSRQDNQDIIQQLIWETGKFASITDLAKMPDGNTKVIKQEKIIWDFN